MLPKNDSRIHLKMLQDSLGWPNLVGAVPVEPGQIPPKDLILAVLQTEKDMLQQYSGGWCFQRFLGDMSDFLVCVCVCVFYL